MWETWVRSLEKGKAPTPEFWPGEFHRLYSPWGRKESDTTEWLSLPLSVRSWMPCVCDSGGVALRGEVRTLRKAFRTNEMGHFCARLQPVGERVDSVTDGRGFSFCELGQLDIKGWGSPHHPGLTGRMEWHGPSRLACGGGSPLAGGDLMGQAGGLSSPRRPERGRVLALVPSCPWWCECNSWGLLNTPGDAHVARMANSDHDRIKVRVKRR